MAVRRKIHVTQSVDDIDMHGHLLNRAVLRADGDAAQSTVGV